MVGAVKVNTPVPLPLLVPPTPELCVAPPVPLHALLLDAKEVGVSVPSAGVPGASPMVPVPESVEEVVMVGDTVATPDALLFTKDSVG